MVKPPFCTDCGREPWDCPSCGSYRCACPNPFQVQAVKDGAKKPKLMGSKHYDKNGKPFGAQFIDGYVPEDYPDDDEDLLWLIEGGLS